MGPNHFRGYMMSSRQKKWYETFFEGDYYRMFSSRPVLSRPEMIAQQVEFIVQALEPRPGARILDVACGHGRIAVPLAQLGYRVTGVDLSAYHLGLAKEAAADAGVEVRWVHSDMREIDFDSEFDAVINVFTSFGYFEDEADDARVLAAVGHALVPGGRFFIDTMNREWLIRNFSPNDWQEETDGLITMERRRLLLADSRIETDFMYMEPEGRRVSHTVSLRLYTLTELSRLMAAAGLRLEGMWGGFDGAEYGIEARRMILLAEKS